VQGQPFRYASSAGTSAPINGWNNGLWVGDYTGSTLDEINLSDGTVMKRIPLGGRPYATTIVGQSKQKGLAGDLWVANDNATLVELVPGSDPNSPTKKTFTTQPGHMRMTELGPILFVANEEQGTVTEINTATGVIGKPIQVGMHPSSISATPSTPASLWLADRTQNTVTRFAVSSGTLKQIGRIDVGKGPARMTVDSQFLWVSNQGDGTVTRINLSTGLVDGPAIKVGGYPDALTAHNGIVWVTVWSRLDPQFNGPPGGVVRIVEETGKVLPPGS
jgi:hypothetical protein